MSRQREMGVRSALGAGRGRLIRQMVTESSVLALLGGLAGAGLGLLANRLTGSIHVQNLPLQLDTTLDWRIFGYALASAFVAGIAVSLFPAFRLSRADVNAVLHNRRPDQGSFAGALRGRGVLVVAQIAGSMTLLIVAGLLVRSLQGAHNISLGFDAGHVLNVTLDPSHSGYDCTRTTDFYRQLETRVRALPGVWLRTRRLQVSPASRTFSSRAARSLPVKARRMFCATTSVRPILKRCESRCCGAGPSHRLTTKMAQPSRS